MSDIFHEVDEEVRQERLQKWWKKYGDYVMAGVSILVIGVAGWTYWQHYEQQQRYKASADMESAAQISQAGQDDLAAQAYAKIAKKAPSGYALVATLSQADSLLASGRTNDAVKIYMQIAAKDKDGLGQVARMRAAWAQADTLSAPALTELLAPLNDGKSQWRFLAKELLAYRAMKDKDLATALRGYQSLSDAKDAPQSVRGRAKAMVALINAGGLTDYGSVPEPPKAETPAAAAPTPAAAPDAAKPKAASKESK